MAEQKRRSKSRRAFWWQVISGVFLVVLATVHMVADHFVVPGGLRTYADVVAYIGTPAIFLLETVFLIMVTVHALLGVRAVLLDLSPSETTTRRLDRVLVLLGVVTMIYATGLMAVVARGGL